MRPFCSALSPGLLSRTAVRSDLLFTKLLEQGLRSFQIVHSSSEGANGEGASQPNLVCGTTPARQARLKERGGPDAPALGCIQLGAGEVVVVAIQSAGDQHLPVREQGGRVLVARGVQATGAGPGPAGRVVQFRASEEAAATLPGCDEHLPGGEQRCRVTGPGGMHTF